MKALFILASFSLPFQPPHPRPFEPSPHSGAVPESYVKLDDEMSPTLQSQSNALVLQGKNHKLQAKIFKRKNKNKKLIKIKKSSLSNHRKSIPFGSLI